MAQLKLYTKEQVRKVWKAGQKYWKTSGTSITLEELLEQEISIELPSDEEIDAHVEDDFLNSTEVHKYSEEVQLLMKAMCKAGMKYMRDKIQGGNK